MSKQVATYGALAALGAVALYAAYRYARTLNPVSVASAAGSAASTVAGAAVQGVGAVVGVPVTDEAKCQLALSSDNLFDVSKYCSAGTFLSASKNRMLGKPLNGTSGTPVPVAGSNDPEMVRLLRYDSIAAISQLPDQTDAETSRLNSAGLPFTDSNAVVNDSAGAQNATSDNQEQSAAPYSWQFLGA